MRRHGRVVSLPGWREGGDSLAWWRAMVARQCAVETEPGVFFLFPKEAL